MKKFLPIIALLVFTSVAQSQNNKRYWNEGKLRWNDFRVISTTEPQKSYLQYTIAYYPDSKDSNGIRYKMRARQPVAERKTRPIKRQMALRSQRPSKYLITSTRSARCTLYVRYMYGICTLRKRTNTVHIAYI